MKGVIRKGSTFDRLKEELFDHSARDDADMYSLFKRGRATIKYEDGQAWYVYDVHKISMR